MTREPAPGPKQEEQDEVIITLKGDDGSSYDCQILDVIDFEEHKYGILLKRKDNNAEPGNEDDEEESLVIMRVVQKGGQLIFQTIESDEEFERVVDHVEKMARAAAAGEQ